MTLSDTFSMLFGNLIDTYGVYIQIPIGKVRCPNCFYDPVSKKSNGIYNTNNPYSLDSGKNKPFNKGSVCPVCKGEGYIVDYQKVRGLVHWGMQTMTDRGIVLLDDNSAVVKIPYKYYNNIREDSIVYLPSLDGNYVQCKITSSLTPFGIGQDNFIKFICRKIG